jgi:hypothetical protein
VRGSRAASRPKYTLRTNGALVGEREPAGQMARRLIGCLPVKGHERGRHTRQSPNLRPPAVVHGCDLDVIGTPGDGFFETMNDHRFFGIGLDAERKTILRICDDRSSETRREGAADSSHRSDQAARRLEFIFADRISTSFPRVIHRFSTCSNSWFRSSGCDLLCHRARITMPSPALE